MANYLGRREKGVKKIREKGDENLGDMGPSIGPGMWHTLKDPRNFVLELDTLDPKLSFELG